MNIGNFILQDKWQKFEQVGDGASYYIQALSDSVAYIVSDVAPKETQGGGVIPYAKQLKFKKVGGDLYLRSANNIFRQTVHIEKEEA